MTAWQLDGRYEDKVKERKCRAGGNSTFRDSIRDLPALIL